jgi:peptidoglycan-associated lipoprotein
MRKTVILLLMGLAVTILVAGCCQMETIPPVVEQPPPPPEPTPPPPPPPPPPEVKEIRLEPIHFDYNRFDLRPGDVEIMKRNLATLQENPGTIVKVEGHCDERGTVEYNLALGEKRAKAAMDFLVKMGVDASRLSIVSYGKEKSVDPGHDESAWWKNRRAEFVIVKQ